jgi:hypothetical protein
MRPAVAGALVSLALLVLPFPARADAPPTLRIGTITIRALDVYSPEEARKGAPYRLADRVHMETKPRVIRGFLLFNEGDAYAPERLAETERNLRALSFLKSASVTAGEPHDGVVDILVVTQDSWSIDLGTEAGNKGGTSTYGATITDSNVLGLGKELSLSWDKEVDRSRLALDYQDVAFFAPYWRAHFTYAKNSDGYDQLVEVRRPFYAFATPWAVNVLGRNVQQDSTIYRDSFILQRFTQDHREMMVSYGRAIDPNDLVARRLTGGVRLQHDEFREMREFQGAKLPDERDFHYLFVRYANVVDDFLKLNYVNKDMRYEDFNLGQQASVEAAVSPAFLGGGATTGFVRATETIGYRLRRGSYILPSAAIETRLDGGIRNAIFNGNVRYVQKFDTQYPQVLVGRLAINRGWRLDRDVQFFADAENGLRGYRVHAYEGDRSIVVNVEHRLYLGRELLQLISPGIVAFVDSGMAGNHYGAFKTDIGVGIRIGLPRTPKNLLRVDLSYALNADPRGKRGMLVSVSSGQAF